MESDVWVRLRAAAWVLAVCLLGPDFHEVPLDTFIVGREIHAVRNDCCFLTLVPRMVHVNLIERTRSTLCDQSNSGS